MSCAVHKVDSRFVASSLLIVALCAQIPDDILDNAALKEAISVIPENYNFEVRSPHLTHNRMTCVPFIVLLIIRFSCEEFEASLPTVRLSSPDSPMYFSKLPT